MSLKRDATWTALDTFVAAGLAFVFRLIVARALSPHDFGLAAIALSIVAVLQVVNDFGLTAALIQKDEAKVTPSLINTTFTASMIVSLVLALVTAGAVAPFAAHFYQEPMVGALLLLLSLTLLPSPFGTVASALMFRQRRFRDVAINRVITTILSVIVAAAVLWIYPSPWVVAIQALANSILSTAGICIAARWRFRFELDSAHLKELFGFSSLVLGGDLIGTFQINAGVFVLGRALSAADVGFYSLALVMTDMVRKSLMSILNRVTFVHYSQNKDDLPRIRRAYISTVVWNCRLLFPVMTAMLLFGPPLAVSFLGPEWIDLTPVIQWLSISVIVHAAGGTTSTLYKGMGRPGLDLAIIVCTTVFVLFPSLIFGAYFYGLIGAAIATVAVKVFAVVTRQFLLNRLIGSTVRPVLSNLIRFSLLQTPLVIAWALGELIWPNHDLFTDIALALVGIAIYSIIELPRAFPAWHIFLLGWRRKRRVV